MDALASGRGRIARAGVGLSGDDPPLVATDRDGRRPPGWFPRRSYLARDCNDQSKLAKFQPVYRDRHRRRRPGRRDRTADKFVYHQTGNDLLFSRPCRDKRTSFHRRSDRKVSV